MTQALGAWRQGRPRSFRQLSLWLLCVCGLPPAAFAQAPAFLVKDINTQPVTASSNPRGFTTVDGTTFFTADTVTGSALWTTDGTEQGTVRIKDFTAGLEGVAPYVVAASHGTALFVAWDESSGYELWASDGTERATRRLADINPGPGSSWPNWFTEADGTVFFLAGNRTNGTDLWKTDGTEHGTVRVMDGGFSSAWGLVNLDRTVFFVSDGDLWKSDGTATGTVPVTTLPGYIQNLKVTNGRLFIVTYFVGGYELWGSDATAAGTVRLASALYADASVDVNGTLFFAAWDEAGAIELWKSDGTPEGTAPVADISRGVEGF